MKETGKHGETKKKEQMERGWPKGGIKEVKETFQKGKCWKDFLGETKVKIKKEVSKWVKTKPSIKKKSFPKDRKKGRRRKHQGIFLWKRKRETGEQHRFLFQKKKRRLYGNKFCFLA